MSRVPELEWVFHRLIVAGIILVVISWTWIAASRHRQRQSDRREKLLDERREMSLKEMGFR